MPRCSPAILKQWQDWVLEHGWAYGEKGTKLRGKITLNVAAHRAVTSVIIPSMPAPRRPLAVAAVLAFAALLGCEVSKRSEVCVAANDGKVVTVIGYVDVGGFSLISSDNEFPVKVVEKMRADEHVRVSVKIGDGPNTMKALPAGDFTNDDIELRLGDGSTKGWGDRVAFTGKLAIDGDMCSLREPVTLAAP